MNRYERLKALYIEFINEYDPFTEIEEQSESEMLYNLKQIEKDIADDTQLLGHLQKVIAEFKK